MTYEEAIEALKYINTSRVHPFYNWEEMSEVRDMAIEALEKQIPKKTDYDKDGTPRCAICMWDEFYNKEAMRYCPSCGQAIEWEETE